jgi:hypothetical protein
MKNSHYIGSVNGSFLISSLFLEKLNIMIIDFIQNANVIWNELALAPLFNHYIYVFGLSPTLLKTDRQEEATSRPNQTFSAYDDHLNSLALWSLFASHIRLVLSGSRSIHILRYYYQIQTFPNLHA